ncbi:hypothetical protein [Ramlibacter sp. PS4R-6]|uniref:hypothetical protein n=1 Tax=Ramlibacter sp. PS4R-6 TaxID=3133438 RepID=UPI0030A3F454
MRLLIGLLAAAGLAGCATYDDGYTTATVYGTTTYSTAPAYGYYSYNAPVYGPYGRSYRDRDGDGVPNLYDRRPDDPYRR